MTGLEMTNLKQLSGLTAGVLMALALPGLAADSDNLSVRYNINIGAASVFTLGYDAAISADSYSIRTELVPQGIAGLFVSLKQTMKVSGTIMDGHARPTSFSLKVKKKRKTRKLKLTWGEGPVPEAERSKKLGSRKGEAIDKAMEPNLPDPLSVLMRLGLSSSKDLCRTSYRVYNGMEIYDLKFTRLADEEFKGNSKGIYRGPVYKCKFVYEPIAGLSAKKMRKARKNPAGFFVWFAPVKTTVLDRTLLLPIAVAGTLKGKTFTSYAGSATINGEALNPQSVASQ